jgi:hypothetical protein
LADESGVGTVEQLVMGLAHMKVVVLAYELELALVGQSVVELGQG